MIQENLYLCVSEIFNRMIPNINQILVNLFEKLQKLCMKWNLRNYVSVINVVFEIDVWFFDSVSE